MAEPEGCIMTVSSVVRVPAAVGLAMILCTGIAGCSVAEGVARSVARGIDRVAGSVFGEPVQSDGGTSSAGPSASADPLEEPTGRASDEGNTPIELIGVGDCLDDAEIALDPTIDAVYSLDVVNCGGLHDSEVFGVAELPQTAFPDEEELYLAADDACLEMFEAYTGEAFESSALDFSFYLASPQKGDAADRIALCVLYDVSGATMTGTARDQGV